jgi:hypothetical protein
MSYLRHLCLLTYSGVQHILCCVSCFVCLRLVFYVPNVVSFSGLSNMNIKKNRFCTTRNIIQIKAKFDQLVEISFPVMTIAQQM